MIDTLARNLVALKKEFKQVYVGSSHIQEIIPKLYSEKFPIAQKDLDMLHHFISKNPIYYNSYEQNIMGTICIVYEGDINKYWLNSISHGSSYQPFSPTWMVSAYVMTMIAKNLGFSEVLDIGSGDGRIAYCAKILGLDAYGIEIDEMLVDLQKNICAETKINFNPKCADAVTFDYDCLDLKSPAFFIGGLAQMGGDILATSIIKNLDDAMRQKTCMIFAGSYSEKYSFGNTTQAGWGKLIESNGLKVIQSTFLPTVWSFNQEIDTSYIFTKFA